MIGTWKRRRRGRNRSAGALAGLVVAATVALGTTRAPGASAASSADRIAQQIAKGIAQGAGGKVSNADATCLGKAILAKLGTAGVVKAGKAASFAGIAFSTRVAMFDAMKQCPAGLGSIIGAGLRGDGLNLATSDALCIGRAAAKQLTGRQMVELAGGGTASKATQIAVFTAFRACPDSLGPLMTKGLEGNGSIPLTASESTCMGRALVTKLSGDQLYSLSTGALDQALTTRVFTVMAPCGDALAKLVEGGFKQSDPTLRDAEGLCRARKLLAAYSPAELVAITSGTPTDAQKKKLATQMQKIATACKSAR